MVLTLETLYNLRNSHIMMDENVFDTKEMSEDERKMFIYTIFNTRLNKENLEKAEVMTKKCIEYINLVHQEIFGTQYKSADKLKKNKSSSNKKVNFTTNTYFE